MDFTKIENIIFVSVLGALCALFLAAVIAVAAKGKRKCRAIDVVLRIFAVLVFIAAALLFTCSVMIDLSGSFRIDLSDAQAVMIVGGWSYSLPLVQVFVALATIIGRYLALGLAVLALLALILDCVLSNKKKKKDKKATARKSPEQIKREQEIARIRKLANAAVEKSNSAVAAEAHKDDNAKADDVAAEVDEADEAEENVDWRVDQKEEQKHTEFVGIHENAADDNFDTFDDVPEDGNEKIEDSTEENLEESAEEAVEEEIEEEFVDDAVDTTEEEQPEEIDDEIIDEPEATDEIADEPTDEIPFYAEGSYILEESDQAEDELVDEKLDVVDEAVEDALFTQPAEETQGGLNRDFYIPGIRTYVRNTPQPKKAAKAPEEKPAPKKSAAQSKKSSSTARKPVAKKSTATSKKPSSATTKPNNSAAQKPRKTVQSDKLPVTRRYVIIDRTNAVNVFSDYLKQRDREEKDKLTSSINKIIIK